MSCDHLRRPEKDRLQIGIVPILLPLCLILTLGQWLSLKAQIQSTALEAPVLFDEYGRLGGCDHSARLDNLAIQIQNGPTLHAYIIVYAPEGEGQGSGKQLLELIKGYLVNSRGLEDERINTVYGGRNNDLTEPRIQLWISPHSTLKPDLFNYESDIETFQGKFADFRAWDGVALVGEEGPGLPVGSVTGAAFADMLKQQKTAIAYIVSFNGVDATPGAWHRVAQKQAESLQESGVPAERIKIIYGGNQKATRVQLWILPPEAPPPVEDRGPEPSLRKTIQLGVFSDYDLADLDKEREVLELIANVLRIDEKLSVLVVVRLKGIEPETEDPEDSEEQDEFLRADLPKLIQSGKANS